ncbi:Sec1 family domain-containing protein MIP3 [Phytophthora citrophthora]|uniref:Sec1 family domain-containing protein MIP3 n=1 Tax=Phytophthora citrophthora TaxID=4793 RepID=A0AAD9GJX3_9STRA|nr:Sec1 family domain-containing protein MIP3 [Phytophthora citrophthora]
MSAVNLAEEVLGGVLQAAEQLQGAVVAAETGCIESLRWAGAMPLLLRDFSVQNVVSAEELLVCSSAEELRRLLLVSEGQSIGHLVLLLSGFLWDYEKQFNELLSLGVIHQLTICSSLSERAHECFDFGKFGDAAVATGARAVKVMKFDDFAAILDKNASFPTENGVKLTEQSTGEDEEWGWEEEPKTNAVETSVHNGVQVIHLPLNVVPLLSTKTFSPEPSVFVLSHPTCASAFPLLLHQAKVVEIASPSSPRSGTLNPTEVKKYSHVKDVLPEHIPGAFRRSMRLLAYTLAELMVGARLDAKDRIFAIGATSLKIGHTLLRILNELQEDANPQMLQGQQAASMIIIDRTSDLVSPCSFGSSLLDRILALLPQTPTKSTAGEDTAEDNATKRSNVTEIFPLHGCEPTPLSVSAPFAATFDETTYQPSPFVSHIQWKGGASLCHPTIPSGSNVFRSLAFRPAKLALRDLDKRLQSVEHSLLQQGKLQNAAVTRRPGEKVRGRDVVLRRISKILEAGEPTDSEHSSLVELGVIVLEALERMDQLQKRWDLCRERAVRHLQLRKQGGSDWILPELADVMQRQVSAVQAGGDEELLSLQEILTLLVNAFALSSGAPLEDFTIQMAQKALVESVLQAVKANPRAVQSALPELYVELSSYPSPGGAQASRVSADHDDADGDDWGWNDGSNSPTAPKETSSGDIQLIEAKSVIETYVENLMASLKDCAQQFAKINDGQGAVTTEDSPRSLIAQLCSSIVDPSGAPISEIQHIVDASEQLTRAGIDLLKSGFSKFGFGGGSDAGQRGTNGSRLLGDSNVLVVFVVGGITFEEIQEVHDALSDNTKYQIILGGTTVTNNEVILKKLFTF